MKMWKEDEYLVGGIQDGRYARLNCLVLFPKPAQRSWHNGAMILYGNSIWEAYDVMGFVVKDTIARVAIHCRKGKYYSRNVTKRR